jgi:hypothetical protein
MQGTLMRNPELEDRRGRFGLAASLIQASLGNECRISDRMQRASTVACPQKPLFLADRYVTMRRSML